MNIHRIIFWLTIPLVAVSVIGCTTVRYYPTDFVESLKHPTKFPAVFSSTVQNIEEVAEKNPLGENEEIKVTDVGENKNSSMHLVQIRENGELLPHYHKRHDEVLYVKKGSGIATLDGTRYMIKPGSMLQVPCKTVHKFLNTGGTTFIAVSIFSPPFDGRDEKKIKVKKKVERSKKEDKRLAEKKPEKSAKETESTATKKSDGGTVKVSGDKPERSAEKKPSKPIQEEWDDVPEKPSTSLKVPSPEGKKKSKKQAPPEEPVMDIKDLHAKLTKLLELKEEGSLSLDEYEEKKDALMKGKDIGELPEPKFPGKKKMPIKDEPVSKTKKRRSHEGDTPSEENKEIPHEDQQVPHSREFDIAEPAPEKVEPEPAPDYEPEYKPEPEPEPESIPEPEPEPVPEPELESESEPAPATSLSPAKDKLEMLEEMRQEGLITEDDYQKKKEILAGTKKESSRGGTSQETFGEDERINDLKELFEEGIITEDEYQFKLKELTGGRPHTRAPSGSAGDTLEDERISDLKDLYDQGLITEDDYQFKLKELGGAQSRPHTPAISFESPTEDETSITSRSQENTKTRSSGEKEHENKQEKLTELDALKEQGLISEEEYEFKKAQLLGE